MRLKMQFWKLHLYVDVSLLLFFLDIPQKSDEIRTSHEVEEIPKPSTQYAGGKYRTDSYKHL